MDKPFSTLPAFEKTEITTLLTDNYDDYNHNHAFFEIFFICEGEIKHWCNKNITSLSLGDGFILRPMKDTHYFIRKGPCTHRDICIPEELFKEVCDFISSDLYSSIVQSNAPTTFHLIDTEINYFEQKINDIKYMQKNDQRKQAPLIKSFLAAFFSTYYPISTQVFEPYPPWFRILLAKFNQPETINQSVSQLISDVNYNQIYICRMFKKHTGMTMTQYLNNRRMKLAEIYLRSTNLTVIAISEALGYAYPYRFNQIFKNTFGITPKQYRKKYTHPD